MLVGVRLSDSATQAIICLSAIEVSLLTMLVGKGTNVGLLGDVILVVILTLTWYGGLGSFVCRSRLICMLD